MVKSDNKNDLPAKSKRRRRKPAFFAGVLFAVICFIILNAAMETVSTSEYCGGACHEMNTAYQSWELSVHGVNKQGIRIKCIDCHLPSKDDYFTHMTAKAYAGGKDMYMHHFGGEYELEKQRKAVLESFSNDRCTECHHDLLARPSNSAARSAHQVVVNEPENPQSRCVTCHENVGHERRQTIFSPE